MQRYKHILEGLKILECYALDINIDNIPKCYDNGAPRRSHDSYICVETSDILPQYIIEKLEAMNWRGARDDVYWSYYD